MHDGFQAAAARPPVAVVMPFAGTPDEAAAALAALDGLAAQLRDGDVVVLADNSGTAPSDPRVRPASGEPSPARARNAGAAAAPGPDWLLFLDADAQPDPGLLAAFFAAPIADDVGAVAGEIAAVDTGPDAPLAARYGAARNFLNSDVHMRHPFRPRVAAANLLVRRAAFDGVGGFQEGLRAAEDTDFCWRLQDAGWRLEVRPAAVVRHAYRPSLRGLRAQWRGYAAGRAWLGRRYPGFTPEPALLRAGRRAAGLGHVPSAAGAARVSDCPSRRDETAQPELDRRLALAVDVLLGLEELVGLQLSNRPRSVLPATGRRQSPARPPGPVATNGRPPTDYAEDDGALQRLAATLRLALAEPRAVLADRPSVPPPLTAVSAPALRLRRDATATIDTDTAPALADRLAALAGRRA